MRNLWSRLCAALRRDDDRSGRVPHDGDFLTPRELAAITDRIGRAVADEQAARAAERLHNRGGHR